MNNYSTFVLRPVTRPKAKVDYTAQPELSVCYNQKLPRRGDAFLQIYVSQVVGVLVYAEESGI